MRRPSTPAIDLGIAAAVAAAIAVEAAASSAARGPLVANVVLCGSLVVPLALLRRHPLAGAVGALAIAMLQTAVLTSLAPLVTPLALALLVPYAVGAYGGPRVRALGGLAICLAGGVLVELVAAGRRSLSDVAPTAAIVLVSFVAGRMVAGRAARVRELEQLDLRIREAGHDRERLAVAEQRAEVARELHDVVAHAMTVLCLQAGAARRIWWERPDEARRALAAVTATARETLGHLRDSLDLLDPAAPPVRLVLEELELLAGSARSAGLTVAVRVDGVTRPVPGPIGLVAYRVVQEALTNAIRHAAPTDVSVSVVYERDVLAVDVRDSGRHAGGDGPVAIVGTGHGLRGMRERVETCAGALSFGPLPAGGFAVSARLPLEARA